MPERQSPRSESRRDITEHLNTHEEVIAFAAWNAALDYAAAEIEKTTGIRMHGRIIRALKERRPVQAGRPAKLNPKYKVLGRSYP